jgi:hypothetical protein
MRLCSHVFLKNKEHFELSFKTQQNITKQLQYSRSDSVRRGHSVEPAITESILPTTIRHSESNLVSVRSRRTDRNSSKSIATYHKVEKKKRVANEKNSRPRKAIHAGAGEKWGIRTCLPKFDSNCRNQPRKTCFRSRSNQTPWLESGGKRGNTKESSEVNFSHRFGRPVPFNPLLRPVNPFE